MDNKKIGNSSDDDTQDKGEEKKLLAIIGVPSRKQCNKVLFLERTLGMMPLFGLRLDRRAF